jgi:hypothetical protein
VDSLVGVELCAPWPRRCAADRIDAARRLRLIEEEGVRAPSSSRPSRSRQAEAEPRDMKEALGSRHDFNCSNEERSATNNFVE